MSKPVVQQKKVGKVEKIIKSFDAFPKVSGDFKKHSAIGGTFSLISFFIIVYLIINELWYYFDSKLQFKFEPDVEHENQLQMNVDITVAMPCHKIGADIVDSTNEDLMTQEFLQQEDTWWDLTPEQRNHFDSFKKINTYFREEYHALHEVLWKSNQMIFNADLPKRHYDSQHPYDSCRIFGNLKINKVAGNFHITAGKSLTLPKGHVHISAFVFERDYNFSHRINKFSFGSPSPGIIHPLEGDEKVTDSNSMLFQYFVEIVPTDVNMLLYKMKTYQYSVKDHQRPINHHNGSHGIPGIFFKYDTCALKIKVNQEYESIFQLLVKLCATVGGIVVTNNLLNRLVQNLLYYLQKNGLINNPR